MTKTQETQIALHEQRITAVAYHVATHRHITTINVPSATNYSLYCTMTAGSGTQTFYTGGGFTSYHTLTPSGL